MKTFKNNQAMFEENIEAYSYLLDMLREEGSSQLIRNDSIAHAILLVKNLIDNANKTIKICSSNFCKDFYNNKKILNSLKKISKSKKIKIQVIIRYEKDSDKDFYKKNSNIVFKKYDKEIFLLGDKNQTKLNDFIVVDDKSYRYEKEKPSKKQCNNEVKYTKAIASLNDKEIATLFSKTFDIYWEKAEDFS